MKITVTIDTSNAAFEDVGLRQEIYNIMTQARLKVVKQLDRAPGCVCTATEAADKLLDSNGNTVGTLEVER